MLKKIAHLKIVRKIILFKHIWKTVEPKHTYTDIRETQSIDYRGNLVTLFEKDFAYVDVDDTILYFKVTSSEVNTIRFLQQILKIMETTRKFVREVSENV